MIRRPASELLTRTQPGGEWTAGRGMESLNNLPSTQNFSCKTAMGGGGILMDCFNTFFPLSNLTLHEWLSHHISKTFIKVTYVGFLNGQSCLKNQIFLSKPLVKNCLKYKAVKSNCSILGLLRPLLAT